jgi:hypothetical protein
MALVAEDGTGLEAATVYADVAYATAFHTERGTLERWQAFDADMLASGLLQATAMLDASYAWRGVILNYDQGLKLPRATFLDRDFRQITPEMQIARAADATSLLALLLLEDPPGGANISSEQFPDYSVTYAGAKRARYPDVDAMLAGLYAAGGLGRGMRQAQLVRWS